MSLINLIPEENLDETIEFLKAEEDKIIKEIIKSGATPIPPVPQEQVDQLERVRDLIDEVYAKKDQLKFQPLLDFLE